MASQRSTPSPAPNYGSMDTNSSAASSHNDDHELRPSQSNSDNQYDRPVSISSRPLEPPKPAVRKKLIQQQKAAAASQSLDAMSTPQQKIETHSGYQPKSKQQAESLSESQQSNFSHNLILSSEQHRDPASHKQLPSNELIELSPNGHKSIGRISSQPAYQQPDEPAKLLFVGRRQESHSDDDDDEDESKRQPQRPYPKKVLFIVANEFCERFSYYGFRTVLVLYFKSVLGQSESSSTVSFHLFTTLCYLTPILGAILADSLWGKYKTILYLSSVYFIGELTLVASSIFWDINTTSAALTLIGLLLIGVGSGGIKPCVSAFGGDQFLAHEESRRQNFFSIYYGAINLGSLISMFVTPMLRSNYRCVGRSDCYPLAFGLPCILMFISIVVFLMAHRHYVIVPLPEQNVIVTFCRCIWLALRRKLAGHKTAPNQLAATGKDNVSDSNSSLSSDETRKVIQMSEKNASNQQLVPADVAIKNNAKKSYNLAAAAAALADQQLNRPTKHWLYLASDRFSDSSIEDVRTVLGLMLLFLPTPVFWCLFDQQGSLWTLQATRMDGRVFNTGFVLEPDQMIVANPVLLLASIGLFQCFIYPTLTRYNLLTRPIPRMTVGGLIAAIAFVTSSLIELKIQNNFPSDEPQTGYANVLLVNGLSDCSIVDPTISYVPVPMQTLSGTTSASGPAAVAAAAANSSDHELAMFNQQVQWLEPLSTTQVQLVSATKQQDLNNYHLKFKLSHDLRVLSGTAPNRMANGDAKPNVPALGCPFDPQESNEIVLAPLADGSVKLLYLEQGNGRISYQLFNDSIATPTSGKARVRLLYEFFGSYVQAKERQFNLVRQSSTAQENSKPHPELQFQLSQRSGQVLLSNYIDVDVTSTTDLFALAANDHLLANLANQTFKLQPGTRNLLVVHQRDANTVELRLQVLQDNEYRISMLYQLIPYFLISMSEVMFNITGLEFSYAMAPETMKSVILGIWSLTTAVGNLLTVAVESFHPFSSIAHDFLFYAVLMALDMVLFAWLGYRYKPHERAHQSRRTQ